MNELIKREDLKATYLTEKGLIICDKIEGKKRLTHLLNM